MKVLYFANHSTITGANLSLIALMQNMQKRGAVCKLVLSNKGPIEQVLLTNEIDYSIIKTYLRVLPKRDTKNALKLGKSALKYCITKMNEKKALQVMKEFRPDIVHINTISADLGFRSAKNLNIPVVWHIRELVEEDHGYVFINKREVRRELQASDRIIAISDSVYNKFSAFAGSKNIVRIYNGVDTQYYSDAGHRPFKNEEIVFTIAGRIKESKGFEEAINAVGILINEYHLEKVILRIAGDCQNQKYLDTLKNKTKELNIENNVRFIGFQSDMAQVWRETDIALVCSRAEAFGRVTIEAMLCGALVIGADTMGTKELIIDGEYGFLYKQGNPASLAAVCYSAIAQKEKSAEIVNKAIVYAGTEFSAEQNANNIYDTYCEILKQRALHK